MDYIMKLKKGSPMDYIIKEVDHYDIRRIID